MAKQKIQFRESENFNLEELCRSNTARAHKIKNEPSEAIVRNLQYGVDMVLQPLRNLYGRPVIITSGYRCQQLNKLVGGVANSYHTRGNAADIHVKDKTEAITLFNLLRGIPSVDTVLFEHSISAEWLHVQWDMTKTPRHHFNFNYIAK